MNNPCERCDLKPLPIEGQIDCTCYRSERYLGYQEGLKQAVKCKRATSLVPGCVVMMKASSGLQGYGNAQCVSAVCEPLSTIGLYGHNQHYKTWDIQKIISFPIVEECLAEAESLVHQREREIVAFVERHCKLSQGVTPYDIKQWLKEN